MSCNIHQRRPATVAGVPLFLPARFFPLLTAAVATRRHFASIARELCPIGPPCLLDALCLSFWPLTCSSSSSLPFPVSPFRSLRLLFFVFLVSFLVVSVFLSCLLSRSSPGYTFASLIFYDLSVLLHFSLPLLLSVSCGRLLFSHLTLPVFPASSMHTIFLWSLHFAQF